MIEKVAAMVAESLKNEDAGRKLDIPSFSEYARSWMENYCRHKVEETTFVGYQSYLNAHLYQAFGSLRLNEITVSKLQEFINEHSELSVKSVKNFMKLLSLILQAAIEDGYITTDVTRSKKLVFPNKDAKERIPLTEEQLKDIISNIRKLEPMDQLLLALLIFTGARRGEIIGLKAMDIDSDKQLIHFVRQVRYAAKNQ
ncbi:MAG: tyrosine-type recombinase/integrase family protein, partial [Clostridia bacterium]|nr:tyrosine-type recombinase/integrase family protein [Clostridia bacterium]